MALQLRASGIKQHRLTLPMSTTASPTELGNPRFSFSGNVVRQQQSVNVRIIYSYITPIKEISTMNIEFKLVKKYN